MSSYACQKCGADDWGADYYQAVHQGITLTRNADGSLDVAEYHGDEDTYDDGCTDNDGYRCVAGGYRIEVAEMVLTLLPPPATPERAEDEDEAEDGCAGDDDEFCSRCAGTGLCPTCGSASPWRCGHNDDQGERSRRDDAM